LSGFGGRRHPVVPLLQINRATFATHTDTVLQQGQMKEVKGKRGGQLEKEKKEPRPVVEW
jgi:hypothetical protein